MKKLTKKICVPKIILVTLFMIAFTSVAKAANYTIPSQIPDLEEQIEITAEPNLPKPGDKVKLTLSAYGIDLNTANISWKVDGKAFISGKGATSISFTTNTSNKKTEIEVNIEAVNSKKITRNYTLQTASVDLIWEADTYTPPFYRGKAMYTPQEKVKFAAIMPGAETYKWSKNEEVQGSLSGYGMQSFLYKGEILMLPIRIVIDATNKDGGTAENYTTLEPQDPEIGLYEDSPIYGILFNKELSGGFDFGDKEERSLSAYPYYFGNTEKSNQNLEYRWSINGSQINVPRSQKSITFRNTLEQEGKSTIGVSIKNTANFLEYSGGDTTINFAKPKGAFSFLK